MAEAPRSFGPYRILGPLGNGAMGTVYRAQHRQSGQMAALKTVATASESHLLTIRREIHALARLRHPGIVHILGSGTHAGIPWYAMELIEGLTLRSFCRAASDELQTQTDPGELPTAALEDAEAPGCHEPRSSGSGLELETVVRLVQRLCQTLGFLHGEGIVHRDLKPDNILLRDEQGTRNDLVGAGLALPSEGEASLAPTFAGSMPVLVDFGLASRFAGQVSREALERGSSAGTVAYIAPEQARGELVDARADLYSLGCILYELLSGRPPFVGSRMYDVLRQHHEAEPIPPSRLVAGLPPELDSLVLRLLAKDPRQRIGHASDVAATLAGLDPGSHVEPWGPPARAYLYRPGFSGRGDALRWLQEPVERLRAGNGTLVMLAGASGVGKTRLLLEWSRSLEGQDLRILSGECYGPASLDSAQTQSAPLQGLLKPLQSIADWCRAWGAVEAERLVGRRGRLLELYEPAFSSLPGLEGHAAPAELPVEAARLRLYTFLAETLAALARDGPVLLLIDDLHWADELTLGFLQYLAQGRSVERQPLMVVGAYRTEEQTAGLQELLQAPGVCSLRLGRIVEEDVGSMVRDMLALDRPPPSFVHFLTRHSEGNPFFVAEYLRTAVDAGVLYRDEAGFWQVSEESEETATEAVYEALPLPTSLRELVTRHVRSLGKGARELLETACVLGRECDTALLRLMKRWTGPRLLEAITELLRRQLLEEPAPGRLRFLHDKLREVTYARLSPRRRKTLHRAAALALEGQPEEKRDEALAALGHHWDQAGDAERARERYLAAARKAVMAFAHTEAERLYRAYQRLVDQPTVESIEARVELATKVLELQGRMDEVLREERQALDEARRLDHRRLQATITRAAGRAHRHQGRLDEAREVLLESLEIWHTLGDRPEEGNTLGSLGVLDVDQGRLEEGRVLYEQARSIAHEVGNYKLEARWLSNMSGLVLDMGRLSEACAILEQAREICLDKEDRGLMLANLAILYQRQGRMDEARRMYEQSLEINREVGNRPYEGISLGNLADLVRLTTGDLDRAEELELAAEAIFSDMGDTRLLASFLCFSHGPIVLARGQSAGELLARAEALAIEVGAGPRSELEEGLTQLRRAQAAFERGEQHRLFRGVLLEDLPEGVRRWLRETGQVG